MKPITISKSNLAALAALTGALTGSANGAAVALYDFSNSRSIASAQNFINVGVNGISSSDAVTLVDNTTLGAATNNIPFSIGGGLTMTIDNISQAFTYGNSQWNGDPDINLMGDAWLFNGLGVAGRKNLTLGGLDSILAPSTTYTIILLGSYGTVEFTKFENVTYDGVNLGTIDTTQPIADGNGIVTNFASMANAAFTFTTGSTVAPNLTFAVGKATGATGNAPALQGIAIVPEPSSTFLIGFGLLGLALRRKRA